MKTNFTYFFVIFFFLFSATQHAQVSVTISNMSYGSGGNIPDEGPIEIDNGSSVRILFNVELSKPSNQATGNSTLKIFVENRFGNAIQVGSTESICNLCFISSYFSSKDITIDSSTIDDEDSVLFATFESSSGVEYNSVDWIIEVSDPPIANNSISGNQTINQGQSASQLTGSTPTGGNGSYSYQWQRNVSGGWSVISGATSRNYNPGTVSQTTSYRRIVSSGDAANSTSNTVTVTVNATPPITNNTISSNGVDRMIGSSPSGGNGTYSYQWLISNWAVHDEIISGATGKDLIVPPIHFLVGSYFKRIVTSGGSTSDSGYQPCVVSNQSMSNNLIPIASSNPTIPASNSLVFPNPSNGSTNFHVTIEQPNTNLSVSLISIFQGSEILVYDKIVQPGVQKINWAKPQNLPSGVYSYLIRKNGVIESGKLVFLD
ncbi:MAG: hypothetical protein AAGA43_12720 [Bacteroidota bacterium]